MRNKETILPVCEEINLHEDKIELARAAIFREDLLCDLAELYKVFGDSTRIKILSALRNAELCVCDIANLLGMSMSAISHQLRILKQARLVRFRREGKTVFYSLADDHVNTILGQGMEHVCEIGKGGYPDETNL